MDCSFSSGFSDYRTRARDAAMLLFLEGERPPHRIQVTGPGPASGARERRRYRFLLTETEFSDDGRKAKSSFYRG